MLLLNGLQLLCNVSHSIKWQGLLWHIAWSAFGYTSDLYRCSNWLVGCFYSLCIWSLSVLFKTCYFYFETFSISINIHICLCFIRFIISCVNCVDFEVFFKHLFVRIQILLCFFLLGQRFFEVCWGLDIS
jgi:hypothetical protein